MNGDYIDELCRYAGPWPAAMHALDLYTALYCVDFLAELGHSCNRDGPPEDRHDVLDRRVGILETLLTELGKVRGTG